MADILKIASLEELKPFLNEKGILEIVLRQKNKRYKQFQKVILENLPQSEAKQAIEKAAELLNKNVRLGEKSFGLIQSVAKMEQLGLLLSGLNLCATCVGFAVMYKKMNELEAVIVDQIKHLGDVVKKGNDTNLKFEFNKVFSTHSDMLDCKENGKPYPEEKLRELVDDEYNVLSLLMDAFENSISFDNDAIIFSMFSLLSMLTVTLRYFDEVYYANNHEKSRKGKKWHISHSKWEAIYDRVLSKPMKERLQDYAVLENDWDLRTADIYFVSLIDQVAALKTEVKDNQDLLLACENVEKLHELQKITLDEVKADIENAFKDACGEDADSETTELFNKALEISLAA